jgi:hypothetical protein
VRSLRALIVVCVIRRQRRDKIPVLVVWVKSSVICVITSVPLDGNLVSVSIAMTVLNAFYVTISDRLGGTVVNALIVRGVLSVFCVITFGKLGLSMVNASIAITVLSALYVITFARPAGTVVNASIVRGV